MTKSQIFVNNSKISKFEDGETVIDSENKTMRAKNIIEEKSDRIYPIGFDNAKDDKNGKCPSGCILF